MSFRIVEERRSLIEQVWLECIICFWSRRVKPVIVHFRAQISLVLLVECSHACLSRMSSNTGNSVSVFSFVYYFILQSSGKCFPERPAAEECIVVLHFMTTSRTRSGNSASGTAHEQYNGTVLARRTSIVGQALRMKFVRSTPLHNQRRNGTHVS